MGIGWGTHTHTHTHTHSIQLSDSSLCFINYNIGIYCRYYTHMYTMHLEGCVISWISRKIHLSIYTYCIYFKSIYNIQTYILYMFSLNSCIYLLPYIFIFLTNEKLLHYIFIVLPHCCYSPLIPIPIIRHMMYHLRVSCDLIN